MGAKFVTTHFDSEQRAGVPLDTSKSSVVGVCGGEGNRYDPWSFRKETLIFQSLGSYLGYIGASHPHAPPSSPTPHHPDPKPKFACPLLGPSGTGSYWVLHFWIQSCELPVVRTGRPWIRSLLTLTDVCDALTFTYVNIARRCLPEGMSTICFLYGLHFTDLNSYRPPPTWKLRVKDESDLVGTQLIKHRLCKNI